MNEHNGQSETSVGEKVCQVNGCEMYEKMRLLCSLLIKLWRKKNNNLKVVTLTVKHGK